MLDKWIEQSKDFNDYDEIKRVRLCERYIKYDIGLNDDDFTKLYKLVILRHPLKGESLARYLEIREVDKVRPFTKKLIERGIFEHRSKWFRHELLRKCFEDELDVEEKRRYHGGGANYYSLGVNNKLDKLEDQNYVGRAYHLHEASMHDESYVINRELALTAYMVGDLDRAERCYKIVYRRCKSLKKNA